MIFLLLLTHLVWAQPNPNSYYVEEKKMIKSANSMQDKIEVESLEKSIIEDEKNLKKIEAEGTHAEDYKKISEHLKKRKKRLIELKKKKK